MQENYYPVRATARSIGVSDSTIRKWTATYAEYLSPSATPETGKERLYTDDDVAIFNTVYILSQQGKIHEQILEAIAAGVQLEPPDEPIETKKTPPDEPKQPDSFTGFNQALQAYQANIDTLNGKIKALEDKLDSERAARLSAEIERAKLEGRLEELLKRPPSWWQRLLGG